jgi:hypothetical protein
MSSNKSYTSLSARVFILYALSLSTSCGKESEATDPGNIANDQILAQSMISTSLQHGTDSIAESTNGSGGAGLVQSLNAGTDEFGRTCQASPDGSVTITVSMEGKKFDIRRQKPHNGPGGGGGPGPELGTITNHSGTETHKWVPPPPSETLSCNSDNRADIKWSDDAKVDGLILEATINRTRAQSRDRTPSGGVKAQTSSHTDEFKGSRKVTFLKVGSAKISGVSCSGTPTGGNKLYCKYIQDGSTNGTTRTLIIQNSSGKNVTLTSTFSYKIPLLVQKERDGSKVLKKQTIVSGTLLATQPDRTKIETSYTNVLYDMTQSDLPKKCIPISGTIVNKIFAPDATTETAVYTLIYGGTGTEPQITKQGESPRDFENHPMECDFDRF